ncbi:MAG: methyl-accepting chemotaxis protein [Myxococcaceae bacterium]
MSFASIAHLSFRTKLVALVSALLTTFAAFVLWFFPAKMEQLSRVWLERRAVGMATLLATAVAPGLEFDDSVQVSQRLAGLETAPDAVYAIARRSDGSVLATWNEGSTQPMGPTLTAQTHVELAGEVLHVVQPIRTQSGDTGALAVGFSVAELAREKRDYSFVVGAVALGVMGVGLALIFIIGTFLVRPIRRMTDIALDIADGDLAKAEGKLGGAARTRSMANNLQGKLRRLDEVEQLAGSFAKMLVSLREGSSTLHESAGILTRAVSNLTEVATQQSEAIARQASSLQETQVTAHQIRETSLLASGRAQTVMHVIEDAEDVVRSGGNAIEQSVNGLNEIGRRVQEIAQRISELNERARQIGGITETVKELADQSNMLALNASIEAVRSGEQGQGFGVVAQEIRSLADQSVQAATKVGDILEDIGGAVRSTVSITEEGSRQIETGLTQVKASGENLSELSTMVRESSSAVREIASAVNQQTTSFAQIFKAINDLSVMMNDAVRGIDMTKEAAANLRLVSEQIVRVAKRYRL